MSSIEDFKETVTAGAREQMREFDRPIIIELDLPLALGLIGMVQLALRHPGTLELRQRPLIERFICELIEKIDPEHRDLWKVLNLGFNPSFDE